jgi:hypothetical protein
MIMSCHRHDLVLGAALVIAAAAIVGAASKHDPSPTARPKPTPVVTKIVTHTVTRAPSLAGWEITVIFIVCAILAAGTAIVYITHRATR